MVPAPVSAGSFLERLLLFARRLRQAGVAVSPEQSLALARALEWVDVGRREELFHAARALLVSRREDLALFDAVFAEFWRRREAGDPPPRPAPPLRPRGGRRCDLGLLATAGGEPEVELDLADRAGTYSAEEVLGRRDFAELSDAELAAVERLIRDTPWRVSERRTRRLVPERHGARLHLRRMLRDAAKHGAPLRLERLDARVKQRPMVLLADVSGSMEKVSRLVLQLFFSASHGLREVECFAFGTRLTRITRQLRLRQVDRALAAAVKEIVDFSGGTRIGESLAEFNRRWARRVLRRGAVVIVVSDGWERGDVEALRREMRHLQRRCYRLIWLNPHLGRAGYEPRVEGMAAALPFVDDFLPIHDLRSLRQLSRHLARLPPLRTRLPAVAAAGRG